MPRPRLRRHVSGLPKATFFKPQGIPLRDLVEISLPIEGLEALRLADLEGLTTEEAAGDMGVSRHTFGRVLSAARATVARALVTGAALRIGGGHYELAGEEKGVPSREELAKDTAGRAVPAVARETFTAEVDAMRRGGGGQGGGGGRCGQGQGGGGGQGGRGGGRCGQGRGQGRGQGGRAGGGSAGPAGSGGAPGTEKGVCVCPQCGQTVPHVAGTACTAMNCPACGAAMARQ